MEYEQNQIKFIKLIRSRIQYLTAYILLQVEDIQASPLKVSIYLDESTKVDNCCHTVILLYIKANTCIPMEFKNWCTK